MCRPSFNDQSTSLIKRKKDESLQNIWTDYSNSQLADALINQRLNNNELLIWASSVDLCFDRVVLSSFCSCETYAHKHHSKDQDLDNATTRDVYYFLRKCKHLCVLDLYLLVKIQQSNQSKKYANCTVLQSTLFPTRLLYAHFEMS